MQESTVQGEWEQYFSELFNYRRLFGEIDAHRNIHIGSGQRTIPDIIIRKDGCDLFDVELKQYNLDFSIDMENQLKSYMDLLHVSVGILVCKRIYVYIYNFAQSKLKRAEIEFTENNPDGIKFVELLQKENFSAEAIENFIDSKNNFQSNVKRIQEELTDENVRALIERHLEQTYSRDEIEAALASISIQIGDKGTLSHSSIQSIPSAKKENAVMLLENDPAVYAEPNFDYVIIKTKHDMVLRKGSLYEATRSKWHAGDKIAQYSFVLSVIDTVVQQVYVAERWQKSGDRWEFFGREATGEAYQCLIGKRIPEKYRKKGMASPVVYKKEY
jgi:hypothetical protein